MKEIASCWLLQCAAKLWASGTAVRYWARDAVQRSAALGILIIGGEQLLKYKFMQIWTPHLKSTYLPIRTASLGAPKRDVLGKSSAQTSDRYARIAAQRLTRLQWHGAQSIYTRTDGNLFGEDDSALAFDDHFMNLETQPNKEQGA